MFCKISAVISSIYLISIIEANGYKKYCRIRQSLLPREVWNQWSGYECYYYMDPNNHLLFTYNVTGRRYQNHTIPVSLIDNDDYFWYDVLNQTALDFIRLSFKTNVFFQKWKTCALDAIDCCDGFMNGENIYSTDEFSCPAIWDAWSCFGPSRSSTVQKVRCPAVTFSSASKICALKAGKECFANGTWNHQTDYTTCAIATTLRFRASFHIIVLAVAAVLSFPSVIIFFSYRNLRSCTRLVLHRNLIIVIILRNILTIITKQVILLGYLYRRNNVMLNNGVGCRTLMFFENASKNAIFASMLADGYYLHQLIVRPFAKDVPMKYIYLIVAMLSFIPSLIWALLRGIHDGKDCWMSDTTRDHWAHDSFRFVILGINFLLLIDIIRILLSKMKTETISKQVKTTFRATLFLIPLFGLHILIITNRNMVIDESCEAETAYHLTSYIFEALQGVVVALLFCYTSSEVYEEILNSVRKLLLRFSHNTELKNLSSRKRRSTTTTFVGS